MQRSLIYLVLFAAPFAIAQTSVADENQAVKPPLVSGPSQACSMLLAFKPAISDNFVDMHGFLVLTRPDNSKTELRGGPSHKGSGEFSDPTPVGNPFKCGISTKWGVVVPYIGPHGKIGTDENGGELYSPDGNVADPKGVTQIMKTADGKKPCVLANCIMQLMSVAGKSCRPYTVGIGELRNSNTILSFALRACGVTDPLPQGISAPGWDSAWGSP